MKHLFTIAILLASLATQASGADLLSTTTPATRGQVLRDALAAAKAGDVLELPGGDYDLGTLPLKIDSVRIRPADPNGTPVRLLSAAVYDQGKDAAGVQHVSAAFELGNSVTLEDISLVSTCGPGPQAVLVGYVNGPGSAVLRRCTLVGTAWGLYSWQSQDGVNIRAEDCDITAANVPVCAGASRPGAHSYDLIRCRLHIDPTRSNYHGAVDAPGSGGVIGIACRGGKLRAIDCTIDLVGRVGPDGKPERVVAVTDDFANGDKSSAVDLFNLTVTGPADFDLDFRHGTCRYLGGKGTGAAGAFKVNGTVTKLGN